MKDKINNEIWRDIPGYEGLYQASSLGRIKGVEGRITYSKLHGKRTWKELVLKQKISRDDTCRVSLYKDNQEKTWLVHRLIALTFLPKEKGRPHINHIDGNRSNNVIHNLEWSNHLENNNHAFDTGLINTGIKTTLIHIKTGKIYRFRSMAKVDEFLNQRKGFTFAQRRNGIYKFNDYEMYFD